MFSIISIIIIISIVVVVVVVVVVVGGVVVVLLLLLLLLLSVLWSRAARMGGGGHLPVFPEFLSGKMGPAPGRFLFAFCVLLLAFASLRLFCCCLVSCSSDCWVSPAGLSPMRRPAREKQGRRHLQRRLRMFVSNISPSPKRGSRKGGSGKKVMLKRRKSGVQAR